MVWLRLVVFIRPYKLFRRLGDPATDLICRFLRSSSVSSGPFSRLKPCPDGNGCIDKGRVIHTCSTFDIQNRGYLQDFVYHIYIYCFLYSLPFIANRMAVLSVFQINTRIHYLEKVP